MVTYRQEGPSMEKAAYLAAIHRDAAALADEAERGLDAPVPSCPGWLVADVVGHIGFVHRLWAYYIRNRLQEPAPAPLPLGDLPGLDAWLDRPAGARASLDGLP